MDEGWWTEKGRARFEAKRGAGRENYEVTSGGACTSFRFRSRYAVPPSAFTLAMSSSSLRRAPTVPTAPFITPFSFRFSTIPFSLSLSPRFSLSLTVCPGLFVSSSLVPFTQCTPPMSIFYRLLPRNPLTSSNLSIPSFHPCSPNSAKPTLTRWSCICTRRNCTRRCRTLGASKLRTMA